MIRLRKALKDTLSLPKSDFPLRANAVVREPVLQLRCCEAVLRHQRERQSPVWLVHDGPPYANGRLHMGHFLNKVIKDAINRFKMLQGFRVPFVPGWDCHGLPIELVALEQLKNKGETPSAALIRRLARSWAEKHVESQMRDFKRWGIYGDWEQAYCTMDKEYEALQLELFGKLYDKGMVFRALKPVYWSPSSKTALAESELEYKDNHESKSIHVIFPLTFESQKNLCASVKGKLGALIWTTTPWTLPSNMAICYGLKLNYCIVHVPRSPWSVDHLIMAEERLSDLQDVEYSVLSRVDSSKLSGLEAQHPFEPRNAVFLESEFVTADLGTGLVHASPAHGQEDFMVCKRHFGDILSLVDHAGYFNEKSSERFRGKHIFTDGTSEVIEACKENKVLLNLQTYRHRYPYDWRTKLPVIQRATEQWFVDLRECKDEAIAALNDVEIYPASGRTRLCSTVQNRLEWCISRQRHWGVPIPIFYDTETHEPVFTQEILKHLVSLFKVHGSDCWWNLSVEELLPESLRHLKVYRRFDTLDVWFDSGSSWKAALQPRGLQPPSDLVVEGSDQHRGWFQSSLLLGIADSGRTPYRRILSHGFVLDHNLLKMSKSLGNVIEPQQIIEGGKDLKKQPANGADTLRLWSCSVDFTNDVSIGTSSIEKSSQFIRKIRNTVKFMLGCLQSYNLDLHKNMLRHSMLEDASSLERYMLAVIAEYTAQVERYGSEFQFPKIVQLMEYFVNIQLSAFYFSICKDRLYTLSVDSPLRIATQAVLFESLRLVMFAFGPIIPHTIEEVYEFLSPELKGNHQSFFIETFAPLEKTWKILSTFKEWTWLLEIRGEFLKILDECRLESLVSGNPMETHAVISLSSIPTESNFSILVRNLNESNVLADLFLTSGVKVTFETDSETPACLRSRTLALNEFTVVVGLASASGTKCDRCWKFSDEVQPVLNLDSSDCSICPKCMENMRHMNAFA